MPSFVRLAKGCRGGDKPVVGTGGRTSSGGGGDGGIPFGSSSRVSYVTERQE